MGKNVVLVGFMGTGKSRVGSILARKMRRRFIDLDDEIVRQSGISIKEIFDRYGEDRFRELESEAVRRVSSMEDLVISTGGGVLIREENVEMLKQNGVLVCLEASAGEILRRVGGRTHRPLLNVEDKIGAIEEKIEERRRFYAFADLSVDTEKGGPDMIAAEVFKAFSDYVKDGRD
ncbi:MAG: shikimate kinase [Deltaproteobacteria bacterium]|uniref:Shikimate kinase n=1 Tax=Candidatus Zymogenus saltonus TaxID=2844893 RepID=A0A9D8PR35_9DELT|nr:shikimate kinase [Candidatus Zymogenus saltonus]